MVYLSQHSERVKMVWFIVSTLLCSLSKIYIGSPWSELKSTFLSLVMSTFVTVHSTYLFNLIPYFLLSNTSYFCFRQTETKPCVSANSIQACRTACIWIILSPHLECTCPYPLNVYTDANFSKLSMFNSKQEVNFSSLWLFYHRIGTSSWHSLYYNANFVKEGVSIVHRYSNWSTW